jgi:WD40 repeat protein
VFSLAFSPIEDRLVAGIADGSIRVWDSAALAASGKSLPSATFVAVNAHLGGVNTVAFSPDGSLIASGGADDGIRLWQHNLEGVGPMAAGHTAAVTSVAFSEDGNRVVSGGNDKGVRLWDVPSRTQIGDPLNGHEGLVESVAFVDGDEIVSGGNEHTMRLWNGTVGKPTSAALSQPTARALTGVAISRDGHRIATVGVDGVVRVWNADTGRLVNEKPESSSPLSRVVFDPSGQVVVSSGIDGKVRFWQISADAVRTIDAGGPVSAMDVNRDGTRLAIGRIDGQVTVWKLGADAVPSGKPVIMDNIDHAPIFDVAFDSTGDRIVSGSAGGTLRVRDAAVGHEVWAKDVASALSEAVRRQKRLADGLAGSVLSVAFSPDGRRVASGSAMWSTELNAQSKGFVQLWDAGNGDPADAPIQLGNALMDLAVSASSSNSGSAKLIAASFDPYTVQLWNVDHPDAEQFTFGGHQAQVVAVAVSADGGRIVSGSADGTTRIWPNLPPMAPDAALCGKLTQNMSREDWSAWVSKDIPFERICDELPPAAADASASAG